MRKRSEIDWDMGMTDAGSSKQRDNLLLEVLLDIRDLLSTPKQ